MILSPDTHVPHTEDKFLNYQLQPLINTFYTIKLYLQYRFNSHNRNASNQYFSPILYAFRLLV